MNNKKKYEEQKLVDFCDNDKILIKFIISHTLKQNNVFKQGIRILLKKIKFLVNDAIIFKKLWAELFKSVIYIINRTAFLVISKTFYKIFLNNMQLNKFNTLKISHIRTLKYKVYVHIFKKRRTQNRKINVKSEENLLVGFESDFIYRI